MSQNTLDDKLSDFVFNMQAQISLKLSQFEADLVHKYAKFCH